MEVPVKLTRTESFHSFDLSNYSDKAKQVIMSIGLQTIVDDVMYRLPLLEEMFPEEIITCITYTLDKLEQLV